MTDLERRIAEIRSKMDGKPWDEAIDYYQVPWLLDRLEEAVKVMRKLTGRLNMVTAEYRHHGSVGEIYNEAVPALYEAQCEAEKFLEGKG
jgi:hypothetical protein